MNRVKVNRFYSSTTFPDLPLRRCQPPAEDSEEEQVDNVEEEYEQDRDVEHEEGEEVEEQTMEHGGTPIIKKCSSSSVTLSTWCLPAVSFYHWSYG